MKIYIIEEIVKMALTTKKKMLETTQSNKTSQRFLGSMMASSLSCVLLFGSFTAASVLMTGCELINSKNLSQAKAERIINKYLNANGSRGTLKAIQGVHVNEAENTAKVEFEIANLQYNSYGRNESFSGAANALFIRYSDGSWVMKKITWNPSGNPLGAVWMDTNVKE